MLQLVTNVAIIGSDAAIAGSDVVIAGLMSFSQMSQHGHNK